MSTELLVNGFASAASAYGQIIDALPSLATSNNFDIVVRIILIFVGLVLLMKAFSALISILRPVFLIILSPVILIYKIIKWNISWEQKRREKRLKKLRLENEDLRNKILKSQVSQSQSIQPAKQGNVKHNHRRTASAAAR